MSSNPKTPQKRSSNPTSNGSGELPKRPEQTLPEQVNLSSLAQASKPADRDVIRMCMLKVAYLMEPDMSEDRFRALVEYLADQDWTNEELAHAANVLPRDNELDEKIRYGGRLTPADFDRVIAEIREITDGIKLPMSAAKMRRAIQLEPGLSRSDFEQQKQPQHERANPYLLTEEALNEHFGKTRYANRQPDPDG